MKVVVASAALATLAAAYALVRTASERWAALSRTVMLLSEQCRKQQLAIARLEQKQQSISEAAQSSSAPPPAEPEVGPSDEVIAASRAARADAESLMAAARAWCPPPAPVVCEDSRRALAEPSAADAFSELPHETQLKVFEHLPPSALLVAERVSNSWRHAVGSLAFWPAWRQRGATLSEEALSIPGVVAYAFGAPPSEVAADTRAAAARAACAARALPKDALALAPCSSTWTVLRMVAEDSTGGAAGEGGGAAGAVPPAALRQHQARDCPRSTRRRTRPFRPLLLAPPRSRRFTLALWVRVDASRPPRSVPCERAGVFGRQGGGAARVGRALGRAARTRRASWRLHVRPSPSPSP